jgi:ribulose bisphosphate carboxylase small subunit
MNAFHFRARDSSWTTTGNIVARDSGDAIARVARHLFFEQGKTYPAGLNISVTAFSKAELEEMAQRRVERLENEA